ncbi:OmpA family protein [Aquimarina sp. AU474]|uniref:OmpA family protein n=1 Tax=Aquimarina sp. AU474 TaxID=2108529 RepID=UPI000D6854E6|nr:OmpA family protein [Aquimarina sp. AU474]
MIEYNKIPFLILLLLSSTVFSQSGLLKKANEDFNDYAYQDAIKKYESIVTKGEGTFGIYQKLGDAYYFNSDLENASKWYEKMIAKKSELEAEGKDTLDINFEHYFRAAQSLKYLKRYKEADELITKNTDQTNIDSRIVRLLKNPEYLKDIKIQSGRYSIENLSKNSLYTDFAPSIYKDNLVFSSARKKVRSHSNHNQWTKQSYLNLFSYSLKDTLGFSFPEEFSEKLSSRLHESTSSFNKEGTVVYFTRNNLTKSKLKKDSLGVSRLRILRAKLDNELQWSQIEDLPFNNDNYSIAHPSLSADGKKLYFASDMPGGYGMSDIYVVDIFENGNLGEPQNLGPIINTEGRDTFPFISTNGVLYFSSDGHLGLGGLDIFTVIPENSDGRVYNVGEPVNSYADDFTFIINDQTHTGFFASNRAEGRGDDDIYSFIENTPLITTCEGRIKGSVFDFKTEKEVIGAVVVIRDKNEDIVFSGKTNEKGEFKEPIDCDNKSYKISIQKEGYEQEIEEVNVSRKKGIISHIFKLKRNVPAKGIDLAKLLDLKPIYFASNKALILGETAGELDKIVSFMKKHTSIRIEIGSHTDSKGSDVYNMKLSKRRAVSTANYIISKGVDPIRVRSRGYGETVLINECGNGVKCDKEMHAKNRRSEFIVTEN